MDNLTVLFAYVILVIIVVMGIMYLYKFQDKHHKAYRGLYRRYNALRMLAARQGSMLRRQLGSEQVRDTLPSVDNACRNMYLQNKYVDLTTPNYPCIERDGMCDKKKESFSPHELEKLPPKRPDNMPPVVRGNDAALKMTITSFAPDQMEKSDKISDLSYDILTRKKMAEDLFKYNLDSKNMYSK